jgi:hypothetical protein
MYRSVIEKELPKLLGIEKKSQLSSPGEKEKKQKKISSPARRGGSYHGCEVYAIIIEWKSKDGSCRGRFGSS